jgi:hypothetical protein
MKLNDLISSFTIALTNEERDLLEKMQDVALLSSYPEREQFVIENLIRKSMVSKIVRQQQTMVVKNGFEPS